MAHQAHNIPWRVLADNFGYRYTSTRAQGQTNLFPKSKNNLDKDLCYFSKAFCKTLEEHSKIERTKYPDAIRPPDDDEEVFPKLVAYKIKQAIEYNEEKAPENCTTTPLDSRKMRSWVESMWARDPGVDGRARNYLSYDQIEIIKQLVMHNEILPALRIVAHPSVELKPAWERWLNVQIDYGLKAFFYLPLISYLCLNMLLQKPEIYDHTVKTRHLQSPLPGMTVVSDTSVLDYRLTRAYQMTVLYCTNATRQSTPHQAFFGISHNGQKQHYNFLDDFVPKCGTMSFFDFKAALEVSQEYPAHPNDVGEIIQILQAKGLPAELCLGIINCGGFTPSRRSLVVDDPLHTDNAPELRKYLTYCWQLLIRANVVMESKGLQIDWYQAVVWSIQRLFITPIQVSLTRCRSSMRDGGLRWLLLDEKLSNGFCTCCYNV
ncbi:hypothetical protein N7462_001255 [Penicillium macrosclerotiorum]|uniref:uncharacterized protein n=1 Tax=Penicillium macrosclerotiorum TaxID=303699 RepID=UPI002548C55B|nr:uncharacterized protein N7462_001255 [Penicillium macrosclerotiorum]KAJ5691832.1 hypothetical protein N7462_001255 [Penicillium macrosclerotiorum]